jgi:hypothetical protein
MTGSSEPRHVVTCFLRRKDARGEDAILILRRSGRVGTYQARWIAPQEIAGYETVPMLKEALARVYPL